MCIAQKASFLCSVASFGVSVHETCGAAELHRPIPTRIGVGTATYTKVLLCVCLSMQFFTRALFNPNPNLQSRV